MEEFEKIQAEFLKAEKVFNRASKKFTEVTMRRNAACPHTETETTSRYYDGGYDYTAHTEYWEICTCCRKVMKSWRKDHGYYG